jgi:hypothetical protein
MSYDVKLIGMDVHKEAFVIADLNESGKLVMESVIETKARSILQFLHGLRASCMGPGSPGCVISPSRPIPVDPAALGLRGVRPPFPASR